MNLNQAVTLRIRELLKAKSMTQYRLEQNSGVSHNTMISLLKGKYKSCNLTTVVLLIRGLGMTVAEFFDSPLFENEDLIVE